MSELPDIRSLIPKNTSFEAYDEVIPESILENMIRVCKGDQKAMLAKAKTYIADHQIEIQMSIRNAQKGLLHQHEALHDVKEKNRQAKKSLKKIIKKIKELNILLDEIPYLDVDDAMPGLGMEMLNYIFSGDSLEITEEEYIHKSYEKLEDWNTMKRLLIKHETVFKGIEKEVKNRPKQTKSKTAGLLNDYVFEIAKLYKFITGSDFKVSENDGLSPYTDGMKFVQESMPSIQNPSIIPYKKYQDIIASKSFEKQTFYNACDYTGKKLRKTSKKQNRKSK